MNESEIEDIELELLLQAIFLKYAYDFRAYARSSLHGRLLHLMSRLKCASFTALQDVLLHEDEKWAEFLPFLVVPHTELFRDPTQYISLRNQVLPALKHREQLNFWVAGCSTGEEVVSLAILLKEEGLLDRSRIIATDINPVCLDKAALGVFSRFKALEGIQNYGKAAGTGELTGYFETSGKDAVRLSPELLKRVEFRNHNLATGSAIGQFDFISCRNVLCYFESALQERALGLFRDSMENGGTLAIGSMELLPEAVLGKLFSPLSSQQGLFQCARKMTPYGQDYAP